MALDFSNTPEALFNCIGSLGALVANVRTHQLIQYAAMTNTTNGVVAQLANESDIQAQMGGQYIGVLSGVEGVCGIAQNIAVATINRKVFRDDPQYNQTLTSQNTIASLLNVIEQMEAEGATVLAMTITGTTSAFVGTGNGVINVSVRRPSDGRVLENSFAEQISVVCSADSYTGGATAGNESMSITGVGAQSDQYAFNWPLGSNCATSANAIDGDSSNSNGNLLVNSGFADWTNNVPDNWVLDVGVAGTSISKQAGITYTGPYSLGITGDGVTLVILSQLFDDSGGTTATLSPITQYSFCVFMRRDGVAAAAGTLIVELVDADTGVVLTDNGGVACNLSIDLTALTTVFTAYTADFRIPTVLPSTIQIRFRESVALTNGRTVYLGKASLGLMTQTYTSGPFIATHSGSIAFEQGDTATATITNSRGAGGTLSTFQTLFNQFFQMQTQDLLLPSTTGSPSISDSLI